MEEAFESGGNIVFNGVTVTGFSVKAGTVVIMYKCITVMFMKKIVS